MRRLLAFLLVIPAFAQNPSTPSQDEFRELAEKADQKITNVENAEKLFKTELDKIDPGIVSKTLEGATNAHKVIGNIRKNGGTAYNLVVLIAILDDLSNNVATEVIDLSVTHGLAGDLAATADHFSLPLLNARNGCNDISELLLHATLRFIGNEETVLMKLMDSTEKKP
jgi:hypothetical protein